MSTIYCVGDALIQVFPRDPESDLQDVVYFKKHIGGTAAVTAYSIVSLNGGSAFIGNISDDGFGKYIRYTLKTAGVNLAASSHSSLDTPILLAPGLKNGKSRIYYSGSKAGTAPGSNNIQLEEADILHIAPHGPGMADTIRDLLDAGAQARCRLSLGIDEWPDEEYFPLFRKYLSRFSFVFAPEGALPRIFSGNEEDAVKEILQNTTAAVLFRKQGPAVLYTADGSHTGEKYPIPVVNTINYEAVFTGAFLQKYMAASQISGWPQALADADAPAEALRFASAAADAGASHRSGISPFPALAEVEKLVQSKAAADTPDTIRAHLAEKARADYYRLNYHVMPENGWMNDPNGLIQYQGKYHVFFQHYPYAPEWGPMHWGHVVSDDLLHWEYLPIALTPDQSYERGCFSGSAVDNNGKLTLIYTAHDDNRTPKEVQCIAESADGIHFIKYESNPVISGPPPEFDENFRDPKAFRHEGLWYMVVGSSKNNKGGIVLYSSKDLRNWDYLGLACKSNGKQGDMWECPDMFELENIWVIVTSPMNMKNSKSIFITGAMDFKTTNFEQRQCRDIDYGFEFYAPQTFKDEKGRRILIAWMDFWAGEFPTRKNGWAGALTFPRELSLQDGEIIQKPVDEIKLLRKKQLRSGGITLKDGEKNRIPEVRGDCLEIAFTLPVPQADTAGIFYLYLRTSENQKEKTILSYDFASRTFTVDKRQSGQGKAMSVQIPHKGNDKELPIHILIDKSSVEFFLCGGKYTVTNRIYPHPSSVFYDIFTEGTDITIPDLDVYELG
jgi:beta-fructofuranosidase